MVKPPIYRVHPLVTELFDKQKTNKITGEELSERSGYAIKHFYNSKMGLTDPTFNCIADVAEAMGYKFVLLDADMADAINSKKHK